MKTLDTIKQFHSGVLVEETHGKTKIIVDGKNIDPKSKQGKRIVNDVNQKMVKLDTVINRIMESSQKVFSKIEDVFKGL
jgi:uncharacterized protein YoxC